MTSWSISLTAFVFAVILPLSLYANTPARYVWNNTTGFVPASICQVKSEIHVPFYISQKPNSGLDSATKFKSDGFLNRFISASLLDRSLIANKSILSTASTTLVRVLSVPKNAQRVGLNIAKAMDEGTIPKESLQEIGDFIIEVWDVPEFLKNSRPALDARKTFWQAATENDHYVTLQCTEGTLTFQYVVFDVYNSTNITPIAQVGLRVDQVNILSAINVYTPDEANRIVSPGEEIGPQTSPTPRLGPAMPPPTPGTSPSPGTTSDGGSSAVPSTDGKLEYILCTDDDSIDVLDQELKKTLFAGDQFEPVLPIQSWNEKQKSSYIEVQFPKRKEDQKSGWVPRSLVQLRSSCQELKNSDDSGENDNNVDMTGVTLNTKDCCKFPTIKRPTQAYTSGALKFRARRGRGHRLHAGCDLYRKHGEAAVAVASGIVVRGLYYFYQGVFAMEIKHPHFIARYGEILGGHTSGVSKGKIVKAGQQIGRIGTVSSRCCSPMLHFELYKGTTVGSLTRYRLPPYDRRSDLMNPTDLLKQWEKAQFGKSY